MNSEHTLINEAVKMHRNDRVKNRKTTVIFFAIMPRKGRQKTGLWCLLYARNGYFKT